MGKSLSLDIRERVVSLVETGHSCHEASRQLCISAASAVRIMQRRRRTGFFCAGPAGQTQTDPDRASWMWSQTFSKGRSTLLPT